MAANDELLDKFDMLKPKLGEYITQLQENRKYYHLEFDDDVVPAHPDTHPDLKPIVMPTAQWAIDEAADHILYQPRVFVPVRPSTRNETFQQRVAEKKRAFMNTWWENVTTLYNPLGDGRKLLLHEGRLCLKMTLNWDLIPKLPATDAAPAEKAAFKRAMKKLGHYEFLWKVEILDSETVFEDPVNHRDPRYVFLSYDILVETARELFPETQERLREKNDYDKVGYIEYWSRPAHKLDGTMEPGRHVQWIEREVVSDKPSPYPYLPVAIEDAGFGVNRPLVEPKYKYVGMTQGLHSIFVAESRQMTTMEATLELTGFTPLKRWNMDQTKNMNLGPGAIIDLQGGKDQPNAQDVEPLTWPPMQIGTIQMLQKTADVANSTLKMGVLGGIAQTGIDTASEADQNVRNASAKLQGPVSALERLAVKLSRWALMDIDYTLVSQVTLFGSGARGTQGEVTLGPSDIDGFYHVGVELRTTDQDALSQIKARFWGEMYNVLPFLSAFTAMERGEVSDEPMKELIQRSAEDVFLSPQMAMMRALTGAQSFGEFATMVQGMMSQGGGLEGGPQRNSAEGLIDQEGLMAPTQARVTGEALRNRDTDQRVSQLRAARAY